MSIDRCPAVQTLALEQRHDLGAEVIALAAEKNSGGMVTDKDMRDAGLHL